MDNQDPNTQPNQPVPTPAPGPVMPPNPEPVAPPVAPPVVSAPVQVQPVAVSPSPQVGYASQQPATSQAFTGGAVGKVSGGKTKKFIIAAVLLAVVAGSAIAYFTIFSKDEDKKSSSTGSSVTRSDEKDKLSDSKATSEVNSVVQELELYFNENGSYPSSLSTLAGLSESDLTDEYGEQYIYEAEDCVGGECSGYSLAYNYYQEGAGASGSNSLVKRSLN